MPRPVITTRLRPLPFTSATLHPEPAVDEEHGPRDELGLVRAEEPNRARHVLRVAEPAEGRVREHRLGRRLGEHVRQLGAHVPGRDDVGAHVAAAELACKRLRETDDPGFRRGVIGLPEVAVDADDRRDVDNRACTALHHRASGGATRVEDRRQVRVEHRAPVVVAHPCEDAVPRQPGVVDEDVEVAGRLDERLRGLRVADVTPDRAAADLRGDGLGLLAARPVADDDLGSGAAELERDRAADPARAAGHERDLPLQRGEAHLVASDSLTFSRLARSLTENVRTPRSMRLTRPESTLPGPISTNVDTPSFTSSPAACVNRTGSVSWLTSSEASRCAGSIFAVTVDMNGATGSAKRM